MGSHAVRHSTLVRHVEVGREDRFKPTVNKETASMAGTGSRWTRRRWLAGMGLIAGAGLLAACAPRTPSAAPTTATNPAAGPTSAPAGGPTAAPAARASGAAATRPFVMA